MGTYDAQLKNYYAKASSGNADLGLYKQRNSDGSISDTKRCPTVLKQTGTYMLK